jgi:hypothetical protein
MRTHTLSKISASRFFGIAFDTSDNSLVDTSPQGLNDFAGFSLSFTPDHIRLRVMIPGFFFSWAGNDRGERKDVAQPGHMAR